MSPALVSRSTDILTGAQLWSRANNDALHLVSNEVSSVILQSGGSDVVLVRATKDSRAKTTRGGLNRYQNWQGPPWT